MAAGSLDVSADLELSGSGEELHVQLERGRMRLDVRRLRALFRLARAVPRTSAGRHTRAAAHLAIP